MASTYLTVDEITKRSLLVLHQNLVFVGAINREYDASFANDGAKIGDTLRVRLPNQFVVRTGATLNVQDVTESKVDVQVATQKGVDMTFTSKDLTMDIDDFAKRFIDPAMAVLAATIEADALQNMTLDIYNVVDSDTSALTFKDILKGREKLEQGLAPSSQRTCLLSNGHSVTLVDALKGLFQDSTSISGQYKEGMMGHTAGFDFFESTHVVNHTTGTAVKGDTSYDVDGADQDGASLTVDTGTTTFLAGDVITIVGCNAVHPETKVSTGVLKQFVITADSGGSATTLAISPAIVVSGAKQNVSAAPTNGGIIAGVAAGNIEAVNGSLVFHKDAFTFATADLIMPDGVDFASRQNFDGISMRIVRAYDINNDKLPCRLDVLYGYKTIRAELASRIHADG